MLFSSADISTGEIAPDVSQSKKANSIGLKKEFIFLNGDKRKALSDKVGVISSDVSIFFKTDGAWSMIDLVAHLLEQTGPADVHFATWSIGPEALRSFNHWQETGLILSVHGVIDEGFRNRKPDLFYQAKSTFTTLKFYKSHAKLVIIQSETHDITIMGSANLTKNPRTETGIIIRDTKLAQANIDWIMEGSGYE